MKLTVGVVLGNSFNKLVNSFSGDLLVPILSLLTAQTGESWRDWKMPVTNGLEIRLGQAAGSLLDFMVVSIVLYLVYVKLVGGLKKEPAGAPQRECPLCREMIRSDASRCRYCGGTIDGPKRRTRSKNKGNAAG